MLEISSPAAPAPEAAPHDSHDRFGTLALGAIGVVFGDIGTSPLYSLRESFVGHHPLTVDQPHIYGVLSLVFWTMMMIVTLKYVLIILRADNKGEGGSLALLALIARRTDGKRWGAGIVMLGVLATALFYGDAIITPAISVLSAVEGLTVVEQGMAPLILPIAIAILIGLFAIQFHGTARVGVIFGPVMLLYFVVIAVLGASGIARHPEIIGIVNPYWAFHFFTLAPKLAFLALGSVVLAVTGAEALYADMGHFGRKPIAASWLYLVFPCLMLNYMGQAALLLDTPAAVANPFFLLAPEGGRLPLVILATMATVIASQAVISGAYSVTRQAIQLGFLPRARITHTSAKAEGQIYIPIVNRVLLILVVLLTLGFKSSNNLAAAYGIAVTGTMFITACMLGVLTFTIWRWNRWLAGLVTGVFLLIDGAYFASNMTKIPDGGWFPLLIAGIAFALLTTWGTGRQLMRDRLRESAMPIEDGRFHVRRGRGRAARAAPQHEAQQGASRTQRAADRLHRGRAACRRGASRPRLRAGPGFLSGDAALRLHAGDRRAARSRRHQRVRHAVQDDGHQLLPRPPDADRVLACGHGRLARASVRLDAAQFGKRDGILQAADQPCGRAGQPGRDLGPVSIKLNRSS
jgi:KUP system potassium uptake protein